MRWTRATVILALAVASTWSGAALHAKTMGHQAARPPGPPVATTVVGPAGGAVALPGGAEIVVPAGAFGTPTMLSFREVPPPHAVIPPGTVRVGKFYAIEPRVLVDRPITVTLPYDPALLPPGYEEGAVSIYLLRVNGRLSMVGSITDDDISESSGQDLDVDRNLVTVRLQSTGTYTLLAIGTQ